MSKIEKEFFVGNEVLFIGYSGKNQGFSKSIYQAFMDNGIKVYPVNTKPGGSYDVKVYNSLEELPRIPETAFVLLNRDRALNAVKELAAKGIKRIQFQNRRSADAMVLSECSKLGIETSVACPLMKFGSGFHKFHGFLAGVR